ncbi:MAG TPA: fasciclin domain-containing protein [Pyrinomonadaceae bacterium]|nr:fasciclin domain-containing protein [Pyrinomonadaceae bacterium]
MTDKLNLIETIAKEPKFSTFSRYMGTSNANSLFSRPGDFTVFVPTNEAFAKIPDDQMNAMLNEPGQLKLKALLSYHIVPGKIMAANIGGKQVRQSISGEEISFADYLGIKVNGTPVQARNIEATNGVVHSLGTVLAPPPLAGEKPLASASQALTVPAALAAVKPLASAAQNTTAITAAVTAEIPVDMPAAPPLTAPAPTPLAAPFPTPLAAKPGDTAKPIF